MTHTRSASANVDDASFARVRGRIPRMLATAVAVALLLWLLLSAVRNPRFEWDVVMRYFTADAILSGLSMTLYLTIVLFIVSVVLGTCLAVARSSDFLPMRALAWTYSWVFRAVPALVQLIFWFNLAYLVPVITVRVPFGPELATFSTNDVITPFLAAVLGLGLCEAAYIGEIVRAGLLSVDTGQREAALAIGLTRRQTFFRIVLPQAMRFIVPPLGSQVILLLKGTSLVSVIALSDLLHSAQTVYNRTLEVVPLLMVATIWYLIIVSVLSVLQLAVERYFGRGHTTTSNRVPAQGIAA